ncbi:MAG: hypothetical protein JWO57_2403 [Pseudonocardiales bacterium]|nr:hypothetical protein [Pseudonocardiales bacterium]
MFTRQIRHAHARVAGMAQYLTDMSLYMPLYDPVG